MATCDEGLVVTCDKCSTKMDEHTHSSESTYECPLCGLEKFPYFLQFKDAYLPSGCAVSNYAEGFLVLTEEQGRRLFDMFDKLLLKGYSYE